jgi:hypothetical protein
MMGGGAGRLQRSPSSVAQQLQPGPGQGSQRASASGTPRRGAQTPSGAPAGLGGTIPRPARYMVPVPAEEVITAISVGAHRLKGIQVRPS